MMEDWKEYRFDEIASLPPKIKMKKGEVYPFIPMEALDSGYKYVTPKEEKELKGGGAKFEEGDTLFARITPCLQNGKIAQAKDLGGKPAFGSTEYFVFRGKKNISDSDFIYYLSNTLKFRGNAENSMVGASGRQRADAEFVRSLKVTIPPLPTQRRIASILSAYDELIENNLKRIKLLEAKAQLTYEEWFVRMKFPGHETTPIDKETGLPEGWEKQELGNLILNHDSKRKPVSKIKRAEMKGQYPYYGAASIMDYVNDFIFEGRYILMGEDGTVITKDGFPMLQFVEGKIWVNNHAHVLEGALISNEFLFFFLSQYPIQGHITGVAQPKINQKNMNRILVNLPSKKLLNEFDGIVKPCMDLSFKLKKQNQLLKEARDILLPRLMTGTINVDEILPKESTKKEAIN